MASNSPLEQQIMQALKLINSKLSNVIISHICYRQQVLFTNVGLSAFNTQTSTIVSQLINIEKQYLAFPIQLVIHPYLYQTINNWFILFCRYQWSNRMNADIFIHKFRSEFATSNICRRMKLLEVMIAYNSQDILDFEDVDQYIDYCSESNSFFYVQSLKDDTKEKMAQNHQLNEIIKQKFHLENAIGALLNRLNLKSAIYSKIVGNILDSIYIAFNISQSIQSEYLLAACVAFSVQMGEERDYVVGKILQKMGILDYSILIKQIGKFQKHSQKLY